MRPRVREKRVEFIDTVMRELAKSARRAFPVPQSHVALIPCCMLLPGFTGAARSFPKQPTRLHVLASSDAWSVPWTSSRSDLPTWGNIPVLIPSHRRMCHESCLRLTQRTHTHTHAHAPDPSLSAQRHVVQLHMKFIPDSKEIPLTWLSLLCARTLSISRTADLCRGV